MTNYRKITKENFHKHTDAIFTKCEKPNRTPDYISASGSEYYYTENGVIRNSNHWGIVSNCFWLLKARRANIKNKKKLVSDFCEDGKYHAGYCPISEFQCDYLRYELSRYENVKSFLRKNKAKAKEIYAVLCQTQKTRHFNFIVIEVIASEYRLFKNGIKQHYGCFDKNGKMNIDKIVSINW